MLRSMKIGKRLTIAFTLMMLFNLVVGGFGLYGFSNVQQRMDNITDRRLPATALVAEMTRDFLMVRLTTIALLVSEPAEKKEKFFKAQEAALNSYMASERAAEIYQQTEAGKNVYNKLIAARMQYSTLLVPLMDLIKAGRIEEAIELRSLGFDAAAANMTKVLSDLAEYQTVTAARQSAEAKSEVLYAETLMVVSTLVAALIGAALAYFTKDSLIKPIKTAVELSEHVSNGDLTTNVEDLMPDEAGQLVRAIGAMQVQLRNTISQISNSSSQLAAASEELSMVTEQSSRTLQQQSCELEMAVTAVNELTVAIEDVAQNALETSRNSAQADEEAKGGKARVDAAAESIRKLENDLIQAQSGMNELVGRVNNIGSVLDVIRGIADQTNLLALNAAIEAARAGESGRGFAVVADEVRALARRTQDSTKEIESMMSAVQMQTQDTVSMIARSTLAAQRTREDSDSAGQSFMEIATALGQINGQNMTVASAAEQQATVAREVDKGLTNIRGLSDQTARGANDTKASSAELAKLATTLNTLVVQFKV